MCEGVRVWEFVITVVAALSLSQLRDPLPSMSPAASPLGLLVRAGTRLSTGLGRGPSSSSPGNSASGEPWKCRCRDDGGGRGGGGIRDEAPGGGGSVRLR